MYDNISADMAKDALYIQDACNLGAIVHSFSKIIKTIQEQAHKHKEGHGTDWINEHPVVKIICDKLVDLSRVRNLDSYYKAYDKVKVAIQKKGK